MEQEEIVNKLELGFSIINNLESIVHEGIKKIDSLRHSVLKKAYEGKLIEQDKNDGFTYEILNSIKEERIKYEQDQKLLKKKILKETKSESMELNIIDVLRTAKKPMTAKKVWQKSKYRDDIEGFYAELKEIQDYITEIKKGTESLLLYKNENR